MSTVDGEGVQYPSSWEADVVLRDGRTARLRPITPGDQDQLRTFHASLSDHTVYFRFFAPHPVLSDDEVRQFTTVDYRDRVAFVITLREQILGVGRYDRTSPTEAEVAFVVRDDFQGLGLGSLLLEHLAAAGRENGVHRFVADVLPANGRMLSTFRYAGYEVGQGYDEGVVSLSIDLEPTDRSAAVQVAREHRYEARSLRPLLHPEAIAVVGASRRPGSIGHTFVRNLITGDFTGRLHVVHPIARQILGIPCVPTLVSIDDDVDLVVIAVAAEEVSVIIDQAAEAGARAVMVISGGFETPGAAADLARQARAAGMRLLGPASLGVATTGGDTTMNASLLPELPSRGSFGFFSQSGALSVDILRRMDSRGLGLSTFVSAGHRADVSGNDVLQYWEEDRDTAAILMYLETVGNPRKFARIIQRVSRNKPVVVLRTTGSRMRHPGGPAIPVEGQQVVATDEVISDSGVIEVSSIEELLDTAEILDMGSVPVGDRVGIVSNSEAVEILARHAAQEHGLHCTAASRVLARRSSPHQFRRFLDDTIRDRDVDIVVACYVPPVESDDDQAVREIIATLGTSVAKPVIAVMLGWSASALRDLVNRRSGVRLPVFSDVEHALSAIGRVASYTRERAAAMEEDDQPSVLEPECDAVAVRTAVATLLNDKPSGATVELGDTDSRHVLDAYGVPLTPAPAPSSDTAALARCRITAHRDPLLGPMVSFGLDGWIAQELGDRHYGLAPLTAAQARTLVRRSAVAAPDPTTGSPRINLDLVADALRRVAALLHDHSRIQRIKISGLITTPEDGLIADDARIVITSRWQDHPWEARSLSAVLTPPTRGSDRMGP